MQHRLAELTPEEKRKLLVEVLKKKATEPTTAPLSFHQQRLWFIEQLLPGNFLYNIGNAVHIKGKIRIDVVQRALDEIVRRHESLRTTFRVQENEPVQVISPTFSLPIKVVDLHSLTKTEQQSRLRSIVKEENRKPFDLSSGPLIRIMILRLGEDEHVGFFCMHHIISDGWSMGIILNELGALYRAFLVGNDSPLPDLPIQYRDYARWQRERLQGETLDKLKSYWKKQLEGASYGIQFATDRPRTTPISHDCARSSIQLSVGVSNSIKEFSTAEGATLYMSLLSAFTALIHRVTGQEDIALDSPVAERERPEVQNLIGFLVNTLAIRVDLSGNPTFRELLNRVRQSTLDAYAHQDLPFDKLVEVVRPRRNVVTDPLLQVMFALQNMPLPPLRMEGLTITLLDLDLWGPPLGLAVEVYDRPEGLSVSFAYSPELFDKATMDRLAEQYELILKSITSYVGRPISALPILTEAERTRMLMDWNRTEADVPDDACIHDLIDQQAARTPDAVAVIWPGGQLSYRELISRADDLSHHLHSKAVKPESLVGICLNRSPEMLVAMLGILKAGCAYVPLDPEYPKERLEYILKDSGTRLVVTREGLLDRIADTNAEAVCVDKKFSRTNGVHGRQRVTGKKLAYVIYTSGSTGEPKGVMVEHKSVVNLIFSFLNSYSPASSDRVLQLTSISFDASVGEIFPILCAGGALVLPDAGHRLDLDALVAAVVQHNVTILGAVPSVLKALNQRFNEVPTLRLVLSGGEALSYHDVSAILKTASVVNAYGPTETTVCSLFHRLDAASIRDNQSSFIMKHIPIGRPIINTHVYALDQHMQPVPVGVSGELYIGGAGVARGYLGRNEKTAERFVANPFAQDTGRLYKTGDLVRYRADGCVEFLGRSDQQVKLRGLRIELGEIESALNAYPGMSIAVAAIHDHPDGEKQLVAYYVTASGRAVKTSELRRFVLEKLPAYMVPVRYVSLQSLPLTPSGKVDVRNLPHPGEERPDVAQEFVAPRNDCEMTLASIWSDVLHVERVGVHDDFFALGGHSLLTVLIMSKVRQALQFDVPVRLLFEYPTVAQLADRIEYLRTGGEVQTQLDAREINPLVPLRVGGGHIPMFCLHYIGGQVHPYKQFANATAPECNVYGIQSRALADPTREHKSLSSMATDYGEIISNIQSDEPCMLVGYSSGGIIALAVAAVLEDMGRPVHCVHLLDTYLPDDVPQQFDRALLQDLILSVQEFFTGELDTNTSFNITTDQSIALLDELSLLSDEERIDHISRRFESFGFAHDEIGEIMRRQLALYKHHYSLVTNHRFVRIQTPLFVWWSAEALPGIPSAPRFDWARYTTESVVGEIIGENHFSMMREPAVQFLADRLVKCISKDRSIA